MAPIPDYARVDIARKLILMLKDEPNSFFNPLDASLAKYVPPRKDYECGKWVMDGDSEPIQVTIVGEISPDTQTGPYGELEYGEEPDTRSIEPSRVGKIKAKFNILLPPKVELDFLDGDNFKKDLKQCANNLNSIEQLHEAQFKESYESPHVTINPFTRYSKVHTGAQASLATEQLFIKPGKKQGNEKKPAQMFNDDGSGAQDNDTLHTWPDPLSRFDEIPNKWEYRLNTNIQAFDHEGNLVHPKDWPAVFTPGTLIEAHCMPVLWDMTSMSASSRTYQLRLLKIRALHEPATPVSTRQKNPAIAPSSLKRKAHADIILKSPSNRPFKKIELEYDLTDDVNPPSPSTSSASTVESVVAGSSVSNAAKPRGRSRKQKEKEPEVGMEITHDV
ncbi:hypothetical protein SCHPADRAFT_998066 [Schizopora paradoxa]|uniref:Uncharacterized protein n=1 Tax=Schizopora paradoxa TaxID=27342 RepID=A0A0H2S6W3_9AGAM|nr:hypothetical protein SCHPADRAFT_998066 [Schizopora paradoxa]